MHQKWGTTGFNTQPNVFPYLYLYIRDRKYTCNPENTHQIADDTSCILHDTKLNNLMNKTKQTLTEPQKWLTANKLILNIYCKTMYVIIFLKANQFAE